MWTWNVDVDLDLYVDVNLDLDVDEDVDLDVDEDVDVNMDVDVDVGLDVDVDLDCKDNKAGVENLRQVLRSRRGNLRLDLLTTLGATLRPTTVPPCHHP